ncbi:hypothetical protein B5C34_08615 [Pacificimonas flava]|uniref:STAS/SEC14 domain-containing protein n=2 Tax=Pacificimonas TaxID=1960290 RepID=A0A219B5Y2_9SPHN|nr:MULTISPECIES: STAS/SEC14 domain-containing protein [Pacificimonas]MBZ6379275.1 STAS/SEC14 domain-containing protein [Pacificimonas aurantium]OWV33516.1 hypothetical protein B5C34_08615 [Pacificimonas flava]
MLSYEPVGGEGYGVLIVSGRVESGDFDTVVPLIEKDIEMHGRLRLLEKIEKFTGMEPMAFVRDIQFGLPLIGKISHVALVADAAWMRTAGDLFGGLFPGKVKTFEPETAEAAKIWLKSAA